MLLKVLEKRLEIANVFSLILEKPNGFSFYPGQYLDVELPVKDNPPAGGGNTRAFTISSSPTERFLMISPKKGVSQFKKALAKLKKGDTIKTSHPAGTFTLDESSPAVFICGGIGITPFRSIIKYASDNNLTTKMTLIYSNSDKNFLFKTELDQWQKPLPNLTIHYLVTSHAGRLTALNTKYLTLNTIYYLAGPPKMVDDFAKMLTDLGVDEANIRYDRFDGY